jgi:hypothetical protein
MQYNDKSKLVLLVQNSHNIFCYFNISSLTVKEFEDRYGENSWNNSKPVLKVFKIDNGDALEVKSIYLDPFANNWYIYLQDAPMDVFLKYGRVLPNDNFAALVVSNTVTTPRDCHSSDKAVYFVDTSHCWINKEETRLQTYKEKTECNAEHREPKPYPFMESKC